MLALLLALALSPLLALLVWANLPLHLDGNRLDFSLKPGTAARGAALQIDAQGGQLSPNLFFALARLTGMGVRMKAGSYEVEQGVTPWQLLRKMAKGDQSLLALTVPEGWTLAQFLAALHQAPELQHDALGLTPAQLMVKLGEPATAPAEGGFFPDTYLYPRGSTELELLARAHRASQRRLTQAWNARAAGSPLQSPQDALTLASIVEKETGKSAERAEVAAVFVNRLRLGMPLQSDPTVIYGLGSRYDGQLTRRDLQSKSPYNTYRYPGLPPTPIALPGAAALQAVLHPAPIQALYFVARGDGTSVFSDTLAEHNAAVARYILKTHP